MKKKIIIVVIICACSLLGVAFIGNGGLGAYNAPNITLPDLQEHDEFADTIIEVKKLNSLKRTLVLYEGSGSYLAVMGFGGSEYSFDDQMDSSSIKIHEEIVDDKKLIIVYGTNPNSEMKYITYTIDGKEEKLEVGNRYNIYCDYYVFETVTVDSTQEILFGAAYSSDQTQLFKFNRK